VTLKTKLMALLPKLLFFGLIGGTVLAIIMFAWFSRDLPDPNSIRRQEGFATQILDRNGETVLFDIFESENRRFTPLDEIPENLKLATVAIEDKDFYQHEGFSLIGMVRGVTRVFTRGRAAGGSTLTQQLVKNVLLSNERSVARKIKELVLAVEIERNFSKDEILQMYLNEAPYGGTAWGISAAAQTYFGKKPSELNQTEAIILAGMPQAPSLYTPYGKNPLAYVQRATDVARRMREDGYLTREEEEAIVKELPGVQFQPGNTAIKAPHFVMYVREQLVEMFGDDLVERGGLRVITTLDWDLHESAQNIVAEEIEKVAGPMHITNGASLIMDSTNGEILSMVGSRNFFDKEGDGQVNVTLSLRQPGSAIKPVTYATSFAKGFWPGRMLVDVVTEFPSGDPDKPYRPVNYDGEEHGPVNLRDSLGSSLNIPAVKLLALVGVEDMLDTAYRMGFSTLEPTRDNMRRFGLAVTLGGGEVRLLDMVSAYSSFSNGGFRQEPVSILKVQDSNGKSIYDHRQPGSKRVIDEAVAFLINSILSDNQARLISFGPNSLLNFPGGGVAVKTGTTNDRRDNWAVGWTKDTVVGVWVGNNDNSQMKTVASGVSGASPIWRQQMLEVISKRPAQAFSPPDSVEQVDLDRVSGYPAHNDFPSYKEWVVKGTLPRDEDPIHRFVEICRGNPEKLASPIQISIGDYDKKEYVVLKENDPLTGDNLWQKAIDRWISEQSDEIYKVPTEVCGDGNELHVDIRKPGDKVRIDSNQIDVQVVVFSDKSIEWVDLYLNGEKELRWDKQPFEKSFTLEDGVWEIRVVARNSDGRESDRIHRFGINTAWDTED
jgi:penicillin-binding protein 1C